MSWLPGVLLAILAASPVERPIPLGSARPIPQASAKVEAWPTQRPASPVAPLPDGEASRPEVRPEAGATEAPVAIRVGTTAVLVLRVPFGGATIAQRAAVVQGRVTQVLLHHPHLTAGTITVVKRPEGPVIMWGPFPIVTVDPAHAKLNQASGPEILAHLWANQLREAVRDFVERKRMPARVLHRLADGSPYTYRRTARVETNPTVLRNTRVVFTPADFDWGPGVKSAGQEGYVIFVRKEATDPPNEVYLGNPQGHFTAYVRMRPEESP